MEQIFTEWKFDLFRAAQQGHAVDVCKLASSAPVLAHHAVVGEALQVACRNDWPDVVMALMEAKVDIVQNKSGCRFAHNSTMPFWSRSPFLHDAAAFGSNRVVQVLLNAAADANKRVETTAYRLVTPLTCAARNGHVDTLQLLLRAKAEIDLPGSYGAAICAAAHTGHIDAVTMLLRAKASMGVQPIPTYYAYNWLPLEGAARNGYAKVLRVLLRAKAIVNEVSLDGWAPLHFAARSGHMEAVQVLVQAKADLDATTTCGEFLPRHLAYKFKHDEIWRFLITSNNLA